MEERNEIVTHGVLIILMGTICNLSLGVLLFGWHIDQYSFQVQFLVVGIVGSSILAAIKFNQLRDAIFLLLLMYILYVTVFRIQSLKLLLGHAAFFAGLGGALHLFLILLNTKLRNVKAGKFLALALINALVYGGITAVMSFFFSFSNLGGEILKNMAIGFVVGSGLGIGFEFSELLYPYLRIKKVGV